MLWQIISGAKFKFETNITGYFQLSSAFLKTFFVEIVSQKRQVGCVRWLATTDVFPAATELKIILCFTWKHHQTQMSHNVNAVYNNDYELIWNEPTYHLTKSVLNTKHLFCHRIDNGQIHTFIFPCCYQVE